MKKVFKSISCFFIIFNFCLNCYSNLIINTAERTIVYNRKIIISYEEDELSSVLSELLKYQNTKLLLEAIALKLEKLENIKIIISKGGESGDNGGYCVGLENEYILKVWYQDLQKKIYRPIVFFFNGRYRMSYLEVPPYIALAHELEHVLNRLELFEQSMSRDVFINGCKQGLKELQKTSLCSIDALMINGFINNEDIVMEKTSVSSYLEFIGYIMQKKIKNAIDKQFLLNAIVRRDVSFFLAKRIPIEEQLVKDSFENLDELSAIWGSFHETTLGPCFLGETIFMREHYKAINEQLHFWCWSHSLIKKPSLGPWSPNSEVKFNHNLACDVLSSLNLIKIETKKQKSIKLEIEKAFLVTNFNDIGDIILVESEEKQYNLHDLFKFLNIKEITEKTFSKELQKPLNKNITVTIDKSDWVAKSGNISTFTFANAKIAQKLFFCTNLYDRKIYSENLYIESISLPLNIEKLVDKGSVFSIEQGKVVKVGETIDLLFKPFEPGIENEIVIEGARIQLRNVAADGNCSVWALLQALYQDQNFIFPTEEQIQEMEQKRTEAANKCPAHDETKKIE